MAITVQSGTGSAVVSPATSITPALPASVASGDLLLVAVTLQTVVTSPACSGYTKIDDRDGTGNSGDHFLLFKKTAGGSESAPTVTWTGGSTAVATVIRVRDCDTATGPAQLTTNVSSTTTSAIDPPDANSVKIAISHVDPSTTGTVTWSGGATSLGEIGSTTAAYHSAAYKLEDTNAALTFTTTGTPSPANLILSIAPAAVVTPPVAAFSGTPLSGVAPLNVTFTDASTNTPTSWAWTFGDGGTSTSQNPSHNYTSAGVYNVQLTATNAGGSDAELKTGYVSVSETIVYAEGGGIEIY